MTVARARPYNMTVTGFRWRGAITLLLCVVVLLLVRGVGRAQDARLATGPSPVLFVEMDDGELVIHTWNQQEIEVNADSTVRARHVEPNLVAQRLPSQIMLWSQMIHTPSGEMTLPPEAFVLPSLSDRAHDAVIVHGSGNVDITIPAGTALVVSDLVRGTIVMNGYRTGVFVAHVDTGSVVLHAGGGTGAVQVNNGPFFAYDSSFVRLRARTARGNMLLERCRVDQIEATSLIGSVVYDNGTFLPGLARFESEHGDVVLGVVGGVEIGAHSSAGRIYTNEPGVAPGSTDAHATLAQGGPVVTATSGTGAVIFYSGALRDHPNLAQRLSLRIRSRFAPGDLPLPQESPQLQQELPHNGHIELERVLR